MSELAERVVAEARSWKGTPFSHQGRIKHVGIDCANFVAIVAANAGIKDVEIPHDYRPHEDGSIMLKMLDEHMQLVPTEEMQAGDVLALCDEALREPNIPRHLVVVSEVSPNKTTIVHASERGVLEHRINLHWRQRIHSCWRLR